MLGLAALSALAVGGCAERGLTAAPERAPSAWTWVVVWAAGVVAALVTGVLLTLPAWQRRGGARLAVAVLTLQTGALAVAGVVLTAVAARSWQLVDASEGAPRAVALLRLSRVDGDGGFLAAVTLTLGILTIVTGVLSAATARLANGTDAIERSIASAVLALELVGAGYLALQLALGASGLPYQGGAAAVPVLIAALVTCWPRSTRA
ncbi:MAG: hypothetical protein ACT452_21745 [Microthrixaceae bacterium]